MTRKNPFLTDPQPSLFTSRLTRKRIPWKSATPTQLLLAARDETLTTAEWWSIQTAVKNARQRRDPLAALLDEDVNEGLAEALLSGFEDDLNLEIAAVRGRKEKEKFERKQARTTSKASATEKNFKAWFGASQVVDRDGRPLIVYHGTEKSGFSDFDPYYIDRGRSHKGFFFSDDCGLASTYTGRRGGNKDTSLPEIFDHIEDALDAAKENDADFSVEEMYYDREDDAQTYSDLEDLLENYEFEDEDDREDFIESNVATAYKVYDVDGYSMGEFYEGQEDEMLEAINKRGSEKRPGVYAVYLRMEDPLEVDANNQNWSDIRLYADSWEPVERSSGDEYADPEDEHGEVMWYSHTTRDLVKIAFDSEHDGLIIRNVFDSGGGYGTEHGDVYVVFDPNQIKSADKNIGTYSREDDDIRKNKGRSRSPRAKRV